MIGVIEGTKIDLLNGSTVSIEDLVLHRGLIYFYSLTENGVGVGQSTPCLIGKGPTLKIILDNETEITVGESQEFLLRNGDRKLACDLTAGDSLMPLYRRESDGNNWLYGYELCYDPVLCYEVYTHQIVGAWKYPGLYPVNGYVLHHKNFNKLDNDPTNLELMTAQKHSRMHSELSTQIMTRNWSNPEFVKSTSKRSSDNLKCLWGDPEFREHISQCVSKELKERWKDPDYRKFMSEVGKDNMEQRQKDPEFIQKSADSASRRMKKRWQEDSEFIEKQAQLSSQKMHKNWNDPEFVERMRKVHSERMTKLNQDPEFAKNLAIRGRETLQRLREDPNFVQRHQDRLTKLWSDPDFRARRSEEVSIQLTNRWKDPEYRKKRSEELRKMHENPEHQLKCQETRRKKQEALFSVIKEESGLSFESIKRVIVSENLRSLTGLATYFNCDIKWIRHELSVSGIEIPDQIKFIKTFSVLNHKVTTVETAKIAYLFSFSNKPVFSTCGLFLS